MGTYRQAYIQTYINKVSFYNLEAPNLAITSIISYLKTREPPKNSKMAAKNPRWPPRTKVVQKVKISISDFKLTGHYFRQLWLLQKTCIKGEKLDFSN